MRFTLLLTVITALGITASAQTQNSTTYTMPVGATCGTVQNCDLHVTSGTAAALLETGAPWQQLDYLDGSANADYCQNGVNWSSMPGSGGEVTWTMSCYTKDLRGAAGMLNALIRVHSVTITYTCGGRIRTTCGKAVWVVDTGSSVTVVK